MASREQFNTSISQKRTGIIFAAAAIALIFCGFLLYIRPGATGPNSMVEGGVGEFSIYFALFVFAIYIAFLSKDLMNASYVVSVGDQGIFDRRISTDWIPWSAIHTVSIVNHSSQKSLLFEISESEDIAKNTMRLIINHNTISKNGTPHEFLVEAGTLKGGFTALHNAVTSFHQIPQDGRAH
ncbi:hypothetical protein [Methylobacterium nonmethylotrophicum]|uniref:Uncharacterized protein n=1 Tax=Methylobacterium nonmethylotrophicum TaxID=1141884 RepID=A0A4Z0NEZ9_9HYPH|nr:hypothetical protein [Methylobacterium nonmethylotrophicum]TGD93735.1 hypothetical protein EU555_33150 [Methylobacterium nonmethylotrophicum]